MGSSPIGHPSFPSPDSAAPLERELKFSLSPAAAARAAGLLALGPPREYWSIYYDTRDAALRGAQAALRLRRVGGVWLQALKTAIAADTRGEWEMPAPGKALDLARFAKEKTGIDLAALAPRLRPVFETRFRRRSGELRFDDATLEVALDRGAIVAGARRAPLLELEIELKRGSPRRLYRYAESLLEPLDLQLAFASKAERGHRLAQGEAEAPHKWSHPRLGDLLPGDALARLAGAALVQVAENARGALASSDPEYLHQLRVGLRRLRAAWGAFGALAPRTKTLKRLLRPLGPTLGEARDWDVLARRLPRPAVRARQAAARRKAHALLTGPQFGRFLLRGLRWIDDAPWEESRASLRAFAAAALNRLHRKAMQQASSMDWTEAQARHALRIRVKRLRYACDFFVELFEERDVRGYLRALERLQDTLGVLNDIAVARHRLRGLRLGRAARERLDAEERSLIRRLPRQWRSFEQQGRFWRADRGIFPALAS